MNCLKAPEAHEECQGGAGKKAGDSFDLKCQCALTAQMQIF